jgi:AcrR family transcriptional regulator
MDNPSRSERSRNAIIQAALVIIARDGPGRLTLDAIARESGISKGGLMHQFRSKRDVLKALLQHQIEHFERFSQDHMRDIGLSGPEPALSTEIAVSREAIAQPHSVFFAILGAVSEEPDLLSIVKEISAQKLEAIKAEADDPDLALLRWLTGWGLALTTILGLSPLTEQDRQRLFERLLDARQWSLHSPG